LKGEECNTNIFRVVFPLSNDDDTIKSAAKAGGRGCSRGVSWLEVRVWVGVEGGFNEGS